MKKVVALLLLAVLFWVAYLFLFSSEKSTGASAAAQRAQSAPTVRVDEARIEPLADSLEALGTIRAEEAVEITANVSAKVESVNFTDNQRVQAGVVLVELDADSTRARLQEAEVVLREDQRLLRHYQDLDRNAAVSKTMLEEQRSKAAASAARVAEVRAEFKDFTIVAPIGGVLGTRRVSPGSLVSPGTVVTTLDAIATLKVDFTVPERWISQLEPGQTITATSIAWPDKTFEGTVASIGTRVDPITRAAHVHALMDNADLLLRPGMLLGIRLMSEPRPALMVSEKAVIQEGSSRFVYALQADNSVERRTVTLGKRRPGLVEIVAGLEAGEQVVVEGTQKIRAGTVVQIAADNGAS
ncbi:MAG: hypothetical protein VR73_04240 [Gammaproteobacteria bacterium BRH_c0]|nr:MAG: hypothetical protein VR73_04240 [Gammaproteobacteria bacterium BRH_c0]